MAGWTLRMHATIFAKKATNECVKMVLLTHNQNFLSLVNATTVARESQYPTGHLTPRVHVALKRVPWTRTLNGFIKMCSVIFV